MACPSAEYLVENFPQYINLENLNLENNESRKSKSRK